MIEASVSALPGLIIAFLIISVLFAGPTILTAKIREKPVAVRASLAIYLAGIVAVTLMPGNAGLSPGQCDIGTPLHLLTSASSLLNIALFLPGSALAVLVFRQPFTVAAAFVFLSGAVELVQSAAAHLGRSCSVTDLAANMAGAAAGAVMGSLYLRWRQRPILRPGRDLFRGATVALMGGAPSLLASFSPVLSQWTLLRKTTGRAPWLNRPQKPMSGSLRRLTRSLATARRCNRPPHKATESA
ncbi:hypothetical protein GPZ77_33250 [Streptomyces sp. QHH-9511]|nr:hypothetical protein GPZ77_33250 [Streptomyces sp. QHH-9511]